MFEIDPSPSSACARLQITHSHIPRCWCQCLTPSLISRCRLCKISPQSFKGASPPHLPAVSNACCCPLSARTVRLLHHPIPLYAGQSCRLAPQSAPDLSSSISRIGTHYAATWRLPRLSSVFLPYTSGMMQTSGAVLFCTLTVGVLDFNYASYEVSLSTYLRTYPVWAP